MANVDQSQHILPTGGFSYVCTITVFVVDTALEEELVLLLLKSEDVDVVDEVMKDTTFRCFYGVLITTFLAHFI